MTAIQCIESTSKNRIHGIHRLALLIWACTLVVNGTHFRDSVRSAQGNPMVDWLIILKVIVAGAGIVVGLYFLFRNRNSGMGSRILTAYILIALLSATFSDYTSYVIGYSILLSGALLLTMGWFRQARSLDDIITIERVLFIVSTIMLLKDSGLGLIFRESAAAGWDGRLGYGGVHPNSIGAGAAGAFWMSLRQAKGRKRYFYIALRVIFVVLILLSQSRTVMITFAFSGMIWLWFKNSETKKSRTSLRNGILFGMGGGLLFMILLLSFQVGWTGDLFNAFNRGQDIKEVKTLTRRTEIWAVAWKASTDSTEQFLFGHGYSTGRLILRDQPEMKNIYAAPVTHNTFLEFLLTMGVLGALLYFAILFYGSTLLFRFKNIQDPRARNLALRLLPLWAGIVLQSITESSLAVSKGVGILTMCIIILLLDRRDILYARPTQPSDSSSATE